MLYVQLDTNWPDHPKIIDAGIDGAGLHAIAMCLAKRLESDGWVHRRLLYRQGATDDLIGRLIDLGLFDAEGDRVRPHGWLDRNPSQAAIVASRASKSEAAKRGNHSKWAHSGPFEKCPKCNPDPQVIAGSDQTGSQILAVDEPCDRVLLSKGTAEVTPAIASSETSNRLTARCDARAQGAGVHD